MSGDVVMAQRDAGWYERPDVRSMKMYHVATPEFTAACDRRVQLSEFTRGSVRAVHIGLRCRRTACRKIWAGG